MNDEKLQYLDRNQIIDEIYKLKAWLKDQVELCLKNDDFNTANAYEMVLRKMDGNL